MFVTMRLTEELTAHSSVASPATHAPVWSLTKGQLRSVDLAEDEHRQIEVLHGECWITMESDANDYVLSAGSSLEFNGPGLVLIEALSGSAEVTVSTRKRSAPTGAGVSSHE